MLSSPTPSAPPLPTATDGTLTSMNVNRYATWTRQLVSTVVLRVALLTLLAPSPTTAQESPTATAIEEALPLASYAIETVRSAHSDQTPVIVSQGELDKLIAADGGGACPISAALIAMQTIRSIAGVPMRGHPHRYALRVFEQRPELKEGRIGNDRFVSLLRKTNSDVDGFKVDVETISAENSDYAPDGPFWPGDVGPDLTLKPGELKILSYTVTTATGIERGRHFVLLRKRDGLQLRVVDPTRPLKDYHYGIEAEGDATEPKKRLFLDNLFSHDANEATNELNTVFTIRLMGSDVAECRSPPRTLDQIKTQIDLLAASLRAEGNLTSPREWRRRGAAFGLPGLDLPQEIGGSGWTAEQMLDVFRHAGRHNLNLRDVVGGAHGRPIAEMDSDFARAALQELIDGNAYFAIAITEQGAGTHIKNMKSWAVKEGQGFRLTGSKLWNARLREATHVVLFTRAAEGEPGDQTAFVLPIDHPGLSIVDRYAHGLTGNSFGGLEFEEMYVGPEHLIGEDGDGSDLFGDHFRYWRLMQAAAAIGCGERALEIMAERIRERHVLGGPIGRFTHLQQPIGEQTTKLRMAVALAREAARLIDRGNYDAAEPLVDGIKAEGVEIALDACDAAMRAHGALGYSRDVDVGDRVRDLMGLRIADGTTDVMRMLVVREAYGYDLWQMAVESYESNATAPQTASPSKRQ